MNESDFKPVFVPWFQSFYDCDTAFGMSNDGKMIYGVDTSVFHDYNTMCKFEIPINYDMMI